MLAARVSGLARQVPNWVLYILWLVPLPLGFWQGLSGRLGPEPIKALEHLYGWWALAFMVAVLAVTPLRRFAGVNLISWRRTVGLVAFCYVAAHLLVWLVLDVQDVGRIWADIIKRPYVTVGMAAFGLMVPLALTSSNWAIRRLGPLRWRGLHRLTYGVAVLGAVHFVMLRKGVQVEPLLWLMAVLALLATRLPWAERLPRLTRRKTGQTGA